MMRFRRYRVFAALSFVILLLLYKSSHPANWDLDWRDTPSSSGYANKVPDWHRDPESYRNQLETDIKVEGGNTQEKPLTHADANGTEQRVEKETPKEKASETPSPKSEASEDAAPVDEELTTSTPVVVETETDIPTIPNARPGGQHGIQWSSEGDQVVAPTPTPIHWEPQEENFPLSPDEIISLPTASAQPIPRIQFSFGEEDTEAKAIREKRLAQVKAEMQHAWKGYSKYAWGHDELRPVSLKHKDPFCGWAATLVDSLDTLWIMGMKEEFDKAVKAVGEIDFTYSPYRLEIPVFETTIRYLGGLLGAYDVSGGVSANKDYGILLDKAGELAEILMGIFDTPNRMPILYYDYKPQSVSRPKMASTRAGVAELGSLLMEFTRLAQLSGKQKYYDAVARITNALDDLGQRGTTYPGLFPETLDVSGCNRTAPEQKQEEKEIDRVVPGLSPSSSKNHGSQDDEGAAGDNEGPNSGYRTKKRDTVSSENSSPRSNVKKTPKWPTGSSRSPPSDLLKDCRPQPIVSGGYGSDSYSIGGSQDSTYEYFPKEYLLLGGKEDQYRRLSIDTLEATKDHLLFRPMTYDERDILFSAKIVERRGGNPEYMFESTHLTCFVGGMFGMAAKIFDNDEYLDLGRRLTDGCVWAYESFPSGIMPEDSRVVPCRDPTSCPWNETLWHDWIDPMGHNRDMTQKDYDERHALTLEQEKADEEAAKARTEEEAAKKGTASEIDESEMSKKEEAAMRQAKQFASVIEAEAARQVKLTGKSSSKTADPSPITDEDIENTTDKLIGETSERPGHHSQKEDERSSDGDTDTTGTAKQAESETARKEDKPLRRREVPSEAVDTTMVSTHDVTAIGGSPADGFVEQPAPRDEDEDGLSTPAPKNKEEAEALAANPPPPPPAQQNIKNIKESSTESQQPLAPYDPETDPFRPLNHSQFVAKRIMDEKLPKGFVSIPGRHYILRPEAIESVWYMYRITGDNAWQEKGWRMFRSIVKATKTEAGHSAIDDITDKNPVQNDSMESFWLAETLKYFYLLFAEPDVVSLDDWVLNTEAHPFRRPKSQAPPQTTVEKRPLDE